MTSIGNRRSRTPFQPVSYIVRAYDSIPCLMCQTCGIFVTYLFSNGMAQNVTGVLFQMVAQLLTGLLDHSEDASPLNQAQTDGSITLA